MKLPRTADRLPLCLIEGRAAYGAVNLGHFRFDYEWIFFVPGRKAFRRSISLIFASILCMSLPTRAERLRFYLGNLLGGDSSQFDLDSGGYAPSHLQTVADLTPSDPHEPRYKRGYDRGAYDKPLRELLVRLGHGSRTFLYAGNDRIAPDLGPVFVKNRRGSEQPVLLRCLNAPRHWSPTKAVDADFLSKRDAVFWRGGSTGWGYRPSSRMGLVSRWSGKRSDIDVQFSHLCQEYALPGVRERWQPFVGGRVGRAEFLRYKYLISAEGNDKDSGLNWKLRANSVVLMPAPVAESWLMEPFLQPFVHYVPLKDDYSDLAEQLAWCRANPSECMRIIDGAHAFMRQFDDPESEESMERAVVNTYFARVRGGTRRMKKTVTAKTRWHAVPTSGDSSRTSPASSRRNRHFMPMRVG